MFVIASIDLHPLAQCVHRKPLIGERNVSLVTGKDVMRKTGEREYFQFGKATSIILLISLFGFMDLLRDLRPEVLENLSDLEKLVSMFWGIGSGG